MRRTMSRLPQKHSCCAGWNFRQSSCICVAVVASSAIVFTSECGPMREGKHPATFSKAANLVVENSTDAHRAAIDLHDREQVSDGVLEPLRQCKFAKIHSLGGESPVLHLLL